MASHSHAARSAKEIRDIRKVLFKEKPKYVIGFQKMDVAPIKAGIRFEHDVEVSLASLEKELHEERLQKLRAVAEGLKDDEWRYDPIEKLLGL